MLKRRGFLTALVSTLAAPAIIRTSGLLMPVKPFTLGTPGLVTAATSLDLASDTINSFKRGIWAHVVPLEVLGRPGRPRQYDGEIDYVWVPYRPS